MIDDTWVTLDDMAGLLGYNVESLKQRLRVLRKRGLVVDTGNPPKRYRTDAQPEAGKVTLFWPNKQAMLISRDIPAELFGQRGGRPKAGQSPGQGDD